MRETHITRDARSTGARPSIPDVITAPLVETAGGRGHCGDCGRQVQDEQAPRILRFGERFCSEAHAERFAEAVRAARVAAAAREPRDVAACHAQAAGTASDSTWKGRIKHWACAAGPLLLLLAIPLVWSGNGIAAAGGSVLSVLAMLACPLGMFFMMRAMMSGHRDSRGVSRAADATRDSAQPRPDGRHVDQAGKEGRDA